MRDNNNDSNNTNICKLHNAVIGVADVRFSYSKIQGGAKK